MAEKKVIRVAIVFNCLEKNAPEKIKYLETFIPNTSSPQEIKQYFGLDLASIVAEQGLSLYDPHIIVHYGLGNGLLWESDSLFCNATTLFNDNTFAELLDSVLYNEFFPVIKNAILKIDAVFSRPEKLFIAKTREDLKYIRNKCFSEAFGFDTENNFLNPFIESPVPHMICFSIAWLTDEHEGWCIPSNDMLIASGNCEFTKEEALQLANDIFFESPQQKFCQNGGYDLIALYELFGKQIKRFSADTMLLLNQFHNAVKSCALKNNTELVNLPSYKDPVKDWIEEANQKIKRGVKLGWDAVPLDIIGPYAAMDAIAVVRLMNFLFIHLEKSQWEFYKDLPHKIMMLGNELAIDGYEISRDRYILSKISLEKEIKIAYDEVINSVKAHIGTDFNVNSSDQLGDLLFNKLKLPILSKTKTKEPSTDIKVLDNLILFHPCIFKIVKFKKLNKLYTSYVMGYQGSLGRGSRHKTTGSRWVFNSSLKQINRTARLSASNMQTSEKKGKGGNILVLPAAGSYVKHYFEPKEVVKLENELYEMILQANSDAQETIKATMSYDVKTYIKPIPAPKPIKIKIPITKKKKADASGKTTTDEAIVEENLE